MNKQNIESPNQNIPVNCLHAVCPNCGKDVDVIPAKGTVIESPSVQEGKQADDLPIFNSGGWISTMVALPRPGVEVEYYWKDFLDEERIYICTCEFDGESTSFSEVKCNSGWGSQFEEFWRPKDWQSQHSYTEAEVLAFVVMERERAMRVAEDFMKSFIEKSKYKQPQSIQQVICNEQAEAARYIMGAISGRTALNIDEPLENIVAKSIADIDFKYLLGK